MKESLAPPTLSGISGYNKFERLHFDFQISLAVPYLKQMPKYLRQEKETILSTNNSDGLHNLATPNSLLILVGFALVLIVVVMIILMHRVSTLWVKYFIRHY